MIFQALYIRFPFFNYTVTKGSESITGQNSISGSGKIIRILTDPDPLLHWLFQSFFLSSYRTYYEWKFPFNSPPPPYIFTALLSLFTFLKMFEPLNSLPTRTLRPLWMLLLWACRPSLASCPPLPLGSSMPGEMSGTCRFIVKTNCDDDDFSTSC